MNLPRFVRKRRGAVLAVLVALVAAAAPIPGGVGATSVPAPAASSVRDWNLHALDALGNPPDAPVPGAGQYPPVALMHLAMVHGAIYDAVNVIDGGHQPFLPDRAPGSQSASPDVAVATAAHDVLVGLVAESAVPDAVIERLDGLYEEALAAIPDGAAKTDGVVVGADAAAAMLAARADDEKSATPSSPSRSVTNPASGVPFHQTRRTSSDGSPTSVPSPSTAARSSAPPGRMS